MVVKMDNCNDSFSMKERYVLVMRVICGVEMMIACVGVVKMIGER